MVRKQPLGMSGMVVNKRRRGGVFVQQKNKPKEEEEENNEDKEIDFDETMRNLRRDFPVEKYSTAELKKDKPGLFNSKAILLSNFCFLIRLVIYHLIIVGLCNNADIQVSFLLITEVFYFFFLYYTFKKYNHLVSTYLFVSKLSQSIFLFNFHIVSIIILKQKNEFGKSKQPSKGLQKFGVWNIMLAIGSEYFFLIISFAGVFKEVLQM